MIIDELKILLIDDDEDEFINMRDLLNEIKGSSYNLVWESNYKDGLQALRKSHFDACLLDYRLGEFTGLELLRESQSLEIKIPIILLTGQDDFDLDLQAMRTGASDYLGKSQLTAPLLERSIRYSMKHALDMDELNEKQENFKTLFNSTSEGIIVHHKGTIIDANAATCEILGSEINAIIQTSFLDFIRSDQRELIESKLASQGREKYEAVGVRRNGTEINLELSNRIVRLKGQPGSLVTIRDLTDRKLMEAQILQQDRLASLGLLASSLAHEIGTPMGVIRGRAELIGKKPPSEEKIKQDMNLIVGQIDRIAKLVNSLLHIARGKKSDHSGSVILKDVIQDVLNLVAHEFERKCIKLEVNIEGEPIVKAEAGPLGQVLLNLLVNSLHAIEESRLNSKEKSAIVSIDAVKHKDSIVLSVRDTGCGIKEKHLSHLFKPFFTTKDIGMGSGLGLATSYNLVQSWGGSMRVESREGHGATFFVNLLEYPHR